MHRRLPRFLSCALAAGVPAALVAVVGPAAGASTAATHAAQNAGAAAAARAAIEHLTVGWHGPTHAVSGTVPGIRALSQAQSTNWSGYADTSETYSAVSGDWKEPSVTCSGSSEQLAAFWVGIDGYNSDSVEQDGTLAECYKGSLYQYSWWEMYPANAIQVVGESVASGDSIAASVNRSGSRYTLKVTDSTHPANSFSTTQTCSSGCANSSAEWIAEAPCCSSGSNVYPLADFHTWTESGASVTAGSTGVISSFPDVEITMVDSSGYVKAQPGSLNSSGNGFSVTWKRGT